MKYKFGDKVKIVGNSREIGFPIGTIAVIAEVDKNPPTLPYRCFNDKGIYRWLAEADIELATPTTEPDTPSKLAALLGVKDDKPFNVVNEDGGPVDGYMPWCVKNNVLVGCDGHPKDIPSGLLIGKHNIVSFKPNEWHEGDLMYYIDAFGKICLSNFSRILATKVALVLSGNAFHTKAEAEENQQRISEAIVEKLGEC